MQITKRSTGINKMLFIVSLLVAQNCLADSGLAEMTSARQNKLLYFVEQDCGSCHGLTMKGGLGPALLPETLAAQPREYLVTTIMQGRKDTAMPGWSSMLTRSDAIWIVEQLQKGLIPQTNLAEGNAQ